MVCILPKDSFNFCPIRKILSKGRLDCDQTREKNALKLFEHFFFYPKSFQGINKYSVFVNPGKNVWSGYRVKEKKEEPFVFSLHIKVISHLSSWQR